MHRDNPGMLEPRKHARFSEQSVREIAFRPGHI
jgi:hypothetical protein